MHRCDHVTMLLVESHMIVRMHSLCYPTSLSMHPCHTMASGVRVVEAQGRAYDVLACRVINASDRLCMFSMLNWTVFLHHIVVHCIILACGDLQHQSLCSGVSEPSLGFMV